MRDTQRINKLSFLLKGNYASMTTETKGVPTQKNNLVGYNEGAEANSSKLLRVPWLFDREDKLLDEVIAWIWYDVANSNYSTVSIATFLPLLLNSYATTIAWERSDRDAPPYCSDLETDYSEACVECRVGEGIFYVRDQGRAELIV